jgi:hypothetical protein
MLKASEAKTISEENQTQYTKDWIAAHLDAAIREAASLGYGITNISNSDEKAIACISWY